MLANTVLSLTDNLSKALRTAEIDLYLWRATFEETYTSDDGKKLKWDLKLYIEFCVLDYEGYKFVYLSRYNKKILILLYLLKLNGNNITPYYLIPLVSTKEFSFLFIKLKKQKTVKSGVVDRL